MGVQIVDPFIVDIELLEPFSFTRVWRRLGEEGRLYGAPLGGYWMHVGDPRTRDVAEARLRMAAASP
jgi:MurNAc alpha-1-phosphate uridylyltransferase